MADRHIRANLKTIDKAMQKKSDPSLITGTKISDEKRALDVSIQDDLTGRTEIVPLLYSIERLLQELNNKMELITDDKGDMI
jgi:hypothetical protein